MTTANPAVPRVNWPSDSGRFKVVQLYVDDEPYMWFDFQKSLHETVFTDILNRLKIRYGEKEKYSKPSLKGRGYRAVGMGYGTVDVEKKTGQIKRMQRRLRDTRIGRTCAKAAAVGARLGV